MKYEINDGTLAIVPKSLNNNEDKESIVYEDFNSFVVDENPFKIMEDSCIYFGSTYEGRKESAKKILNAQYKIPVLVEDSRNIVVFPTTSPEADDCVWVSLNRIADIDTSPSGNGLIIFDNGVKIEVSASKRSLNNQYLRASALSNTIRNRKS